MKRQRVRLGSGIYSDQWGVAAVVKVGGRQKERRFPPDTDIAILRRWQQSTRKAIEAGVLELPPAAGGTFKADALRYLKTITHRVKYKSDRSHLAAWFPIVGELKRSAITSDHVTRAIATWTAAGKAARTIRHRVRVLRECFAFIDPHRTPTADVKLPRPADPHPVSVPLETIRAVAESLRIGKRHPEGYGDDATLTHARFLVRATTGQRPTQIMRAEPGDVDLERRLWFVRSAKGGTQVPLPLNPEAVRAWKTFIAAKAWGPFNPRSFSQTIRRHGWPAGVRPYALRHTFAIDLLRSGADLGDVQGLLGHRQIETTRTFYAPILTARLAETVRKRRIGWNVSSSKARKRSPRKRQTARNR